MRNFTESITGWQLGFSSTKSPHINNDEENWAESWTRISKFSQKKKKKIKKSICLVLTHLVLII